MKIALWAKIVASAGLVFGLLIQIFTVMNILKLKEAGKLNAVHITLLIIGFVVYLFLIIGTVYLFKGYYKRASNILMIAGVGSILFIYLFVGAVFIITSILTRRVYLENEVINK